jgi:predicted alpha/beta hydrolase family esterase
MTEAHPDKKQVLFIQGAGEGAHEADAKLAASLQEGLGTAYNVRYPQMPGDDEPDSAWQQQIGNEIGAIEHEIILVGHSVGASMLLQYLVENEVEHQITGIFLIATPFWGSEGWEYDDLTLPEDFPDKLPKRVPLFLYHNRDDPEVSVTHLARYAAKLPQATIREAESGGHQFNDDLMQVARDIKALT